MATFTEVAALIPTVGARLGEGVRAEQAQAAMVGMTDAEVVAVLEESAAVVRHAEQLRIIAARVIATRSTRDAGHSGLSQSRGHRNPVSLVQEITGSTRVEAARQVRVGEAMLGEVVLGGAIADSAPERVEASSSPVAPPDWRQPLKDALRAGRISSSQFDAILRGLAEPPDVGGGIAEEAAAIHDAWMLAAERLADEAAERTVEELGAAARTIRDMLDPEGAEARFLARFERRTLRTWTDQDGVKHASIAFDDEGAAFFESVFAAALRPRRGGPRFVDADEAARAQELTDDTRTNEQLSYDLLMDIIRAGVLADAETVHGVRQVGVRLVQVIDASDDAAAVGHTEDGLVSLPAQTVRQRICDTGTVAVTVDGCGNPLDVGREQRLFTPRQRIALAIRDGGCRWRGCDRPSSYCEAHHIDEWKADRGRTDIDRGILLCRYHHMQLHHGGWRITREGKGDFVLNHPSGDSFVLRERAALTYAWAGIDPPPRRFRPMVA